MSVFTGKKLKEACVRANLSQEEVAGILKITDRTLRAIESGKQIISVDDLLTLAELYRVDVRELLLESYVEEEEERILFNRYAAVFKVYDKLSGRNKEDVYRILKDYVRGQSLNDVGGDSDV